MQIYWNLRLLVAQSFATKEHVSLEKIPPDTRTTTFCKVSPRKKTLSKWIQCLSVSYTQFTPKRFIGKARFSVGFSEAPPYM